MYVCMCVCNVFICMCYIYIFGNFFQTLKKCMEGNCFVEANFLCVFAIAAYVCFLLVFAQLSFPFFLIRRPPFIREKPLSNYMCLWGC